MKPQDLVVSLLLTKPSPPATYATIAVGAGISVSEAHASVQRLRAAGLVDSQRSVRRRPLLDFLTFGLRVVFPVTPSAMALGVPTGAAAFPQVYDLPEPEPRGVPWVWPDDHGSERGMAVAPLYPSVPSAVANDPWLHEILAMLDLLRAGRSREIRWARTELARRLADPVLPPASTIDPSDVRALSAMFSRRRLSITIARWLREWAYQPLVEHPLVRPVLAEYRDDLARHLAEAVPAGTFRPSPARHLVGDKGGGGARDWSFPSFVDGIVARRLIDELEPYLRGTDDRAFMARNRSSDRREPGQYGAGREWRRFVASLLPAREGMAVALKTDIQEFFASVDHALGRQIVAQRSGAHPKVVQLLFSCLQAWLPHPRLTNRGLPVDPHDVSRIVAHAVLRTVDDEFEDGFDLRYRRFMDDTIVFCETADDVLRIRERHRRALTSVGMSPNERKTRTYNDLGELLGEYIDPVLETMDSEDESRISSEFAIRESQMSDGLHQRRLNGLAMRVSPSRVFTKNALEQLDVPQLRTSALTLLEHQVLAKADIEFLRTRACRDDWSPEARLRVLRTLSLASIAESGDLVEWCWRVIDAQDSDAQARLLLIVFKHGGSGESEMVQQWATDPGHTDALVRSVADYVLRAYRVELEGVPRWVGVDPDASWGSRLLRDVSSKGVQNPEGILGAMRSWLGGRPTVRPECLPLLRILALVEDPPWRDVLEVFLSEMEAEAADPAVLRHVQAALADLT